MSLLTIFACEAQPIVLEGLRKVLSGYEDMLLVGQASDPAGALQAIARLRPQVVLLGRLNPSKPLLQLHFQIKMESPETAVVLWISDLSDTDSLRALQSGVKGILEKTLPVNLLIDCVRSVAAGNVWLDGAVANPSNAAGQRNLNPRITPRERDIIGLISKGMKNKEIAAALSITPGTVKVHLMHIFEKTGVKDRFQLALQSRELLGNAHQLTAGSRPEAIPL